jgi:protocatechuate 3,4-dioxygenase beta subunit
MPATDEPVTIVRGDREAFPPYLHPDYRSTVLRAPSQPLIPLTPTLSELTGPGPTLSRGVTAQDDLTTNAGTGHEAFGQRIIVTGRVLDGDGRLVPNTLLEVWQANAGGRYRHDADNWPAPIDPNFTGYGSCLTDEKGEYRFTTIRPGAYPWKNHENAWRPAHIHFSLFGDAAVSRLVTQMYFPDDPLKHIDPILYGVPTQAARDRLVAAYAHDVTSPEWALGYRWDIVLGGRGATPMGL